jgi:hypothetical protein
MRAVLLCSILILAACASAPPVRAQTSNEPIEACLAAAGQSHAARRACVGARTDACIESDDAMASTAGMVMCAQGERSQWAALSQRYAATLRARESETQKAMLDAMIAAQPQWAQTRCAYAASYYEGGSLARYLGAACMRDAEAELALDLYARLHDDN